MNGRKMLGGLKGHSCSLEKNSGFKMVLSSATVLIGGWQVKDLWVKNDHADIGCFTPHLSPECIRSRSDKMMRCGRRMGRKIGEVYALNGPTHRREGVAAVCRAETVDEGDLSAVR
ncbi:hypothetical protein [Pontiella sp.]|uniref:hypothetical protein n=1 Tax=Pontiella sp. TaxID=2837462 RepID=UPI003568A4B6